ncbi:methyltransferase family protein [Chloroflexota bacterium]
MSLIPSFEIGLWNAWWFMIVFPLQWLAILIIPGHIVERTGDTQEIQTRQDRVVAFLANGLWVIATLCAIFLPFQVGTTWLWIGLLLFIAGLVILVLATMSIAGTPTDKPFTSGVYRFSRHPGYLSMILVYLGVSIATVSWLFLFVTIVTFFLLLYQAKKEEAYCCVKFGNAYREYMLRTARWIGISKLEVNH